MVFLDAESGTRSGERVPSLLQLLLSETTTADGGAGEIWGPSQSSPSPFITPHLEPGLGTLMSRIGHNPLSNRRLNNNVAASKQASTLPEIQSDSRLIVIAGSDTTASSFVHIFYHLATNPAKQDTLRREISHARQANGGVIDHHAVQDCAMLNGTIHEALRLNPPVPSGIHRKVPAEGVMISDVFVPGETTIQMPQYVMGHGMSLSPTPTPGDLRLF